MKTLLPLIGLLVSLPAISTEPRAPTPTEAAWIALTMLTTGDPEEVTDHLRGHGFSEEGMQALLAYASQGQATLDDMGIQMAADLCARGAEFENDSEKLAQKFEQEKAEYDATVQQLVDGLDDVMSDSDQAAFNALLTHEGGPNIHMIDVDASVAVRTGKLLPADAVARACQRGQAQ